MHSDSQQEECQCCIPSQVNSVHSKHVFLSWKKNSFGRVHLKVLRQQLEMNHEWTFVFLAEEELDEAMTLLLDSGNLSSAYFAANFGQIKADIARLVLVHAYGGVWLDINKGLTAPLNAVFRQNLPTFTFEDSVSTFSQLRQDLTLQTNVVGNWCFFMPKKTIFGQALLDFIEQKISSYRNEVTSHVKATIVSLTGPGALTHFINSAWESSTQEAVVSDIDYGGVALWNLKGSQARYKFERPYALVESGHLFRGPEKI